MKADMSSMMQMTIAELIDKLAKLPLDADIGAVPSWGCTILRARVNGEVIGDVDMPTDPDVWPCEHDG